LAFLKCEKSIKEEGWVLKNQTSRRNAQGKGKELRCQNPYPQGSKRREKSRRVFGKEKSSRGRNSNERKSGKMRLKKVL